MSFTHKWVDVTSSVMSIILLAPPESLLLPPPLPPNRVDVTEFTDVIDGVVDAVGVDVCVDVDVDPLSLKINGVST